MPLTLILIAVMTALAVWLVVMVFALALLDAVVAFLTKQYSLRKRCNLYLSLQRHLITHRREHGSCIIDPGEDWTDVQIIRYPDAETR